MAGREGDRGQGGREGGREEDREKGGKEKGREAGRSVRMYGKRQDKILERKKD